MPRPKNSLVDSSSNCSSSDNGNGNRKLQEIMGFLSGSASGGHGRRKKRSLEDDSDCESGHGHVVQAEGLEVDLVDDDESRNSSGPWLSGWGLDQMLSTLGLRFKHGIQAKKLKLDEDFKDVKVELGEFSKTLQKSEEERYTEMAGLAQGSTSIFNQLNNMDTVQKINEHKEKEMIGSLGKSIEEAKTVLEECAKTQADIFQKFMSDLSKLEDKHCGSAEDLMHNCRSTRHQQI